jgi:exodeoxyribonuclease V alpha subunit
MGGNQQSFLANEQATPELRRGTISRVMWEDNDSMFRICRVTVDDGKYGDEQVWKGVMPPVIPGDKVEGKGVMKADRGRFAFACEYIVHFTPQSAEAAYEYLAGGLVYGIGEVLAARIVERFGDKTFAILDSDPDRLSEVEGIGKKKLSDIKAAWVEKRVIHQILAFLVQHGASPKLAGKVFAHYGSKAMAVLQASPYQVAIDVPRIGFKTADAIAKKQGISGTDPMRIQAGIVQALHDANDNGHSFMFDGDLIREAGKLLAVSSGLYDGLKALAEKDIIKLETVDDDRMVFWTYAYEREVAVATRLGEIMSSAFPECTVDKAPPNNVDLAVEWMAEQGITLAPAQLDAARLASISKCMVLTGGPGSGKTSTLKAILRVFDLAGLTIHLCAPTGRAAKRMSEATKHQATTIHRLLGWNKDAKRGEPKWMHHRANPIRACDVLVVDEVSMVDLEIAHALFEALPNECVVVLVGDVDQLPSVGPGAVLRDMIDCAVIPTVRLTKIFRQSDNSLILENAHRIRDGIMPENSTNPDGDFFVLARDEGPQAAQTVLEVVTERIPSRWGYDPIRDVQVLVPMHKGPAGTTGLNRVLQEALNPANGRDELVFGSPEKGTEVRFRSGDKVIQLANDAERDVYNGDIGEIVSVFPGNKELALIVRFDERDVQYEPGHLSELKLAYATTIHKSQGSEYPVAVVVLMKEHSIMASRNLLYTAVTRGKKIVVLIATPKTVRLALAETRKEWRNTRLAARISHLIPTYLSSVPSRTYRTRAAAPPIDLLEAFGLDDETNDFTQVPRFGGKIIAAISGSSANDGGGSWSKN